MNGMWLVCLSLLVVADAASISRNRLREIPVQVVYEEGVVVRPSFKNIEAKPQLSVEEKAEEAALNIPSAIAKIAEEAVQQALTEQSALPPVPDKCEDNSCKSSEEDNSSSSEEDQQSSKTSNSIEDSSEDESNEIVQPDPIMLIPAETLKSLPLQPVFIESNQQPEEVLIALPDQPIEEQQPVEEEEDTLAQEDQPDSPVQVIAVFEEVDDNVRVGDVKQATTVGPFGPIAVVQSVINRLGENIGNALNSIRPASATTSVPNVQISLTAPADETFSDALAPSNTPLPTFASNLQTNINSQLSNFNNRVNTFINNLRPRQPEGAQNEESATTPSTPFLNQLQSSFNNNFQNFQSTVSNAVGFLNQNNGQQNNSAPTQSDEAAPVENNQPWFQQIMNGAATTFNQNFQNFVQGSQTNQQQGDEAGQQQQQNIGQQVVTFVQQGIQNFMQQNTGTPAAGSQGDDVTPAPAGPNPIQSGFQSIITNIGQQFTNLISGNQQNNTVVQNIPSINPAGIASIPAVSGLPGTQQSDAAPTTAPVLPGLSQIPGLDNLAAQFPPGFPTLPPIPNIPAIPGVDQIQQNLPQFPAIPGADQIQQNLPQIPAIPSIPAIPGADQIQQNLPQIPAIPGADQIQQNLPQIPAIPSIPAIPGAEQLQQNLPQIPGLPQFPAAGQTPQLSQLPQIPGIPNLSGIPVQIPPIPGLPLPTVTSAPTTAASTTNPPPST